MDLLRILGPSSKWIPLIAKGVVTVNRAANRLTWTKDGRFAAALAPTAGLAERLAALPVNANSVATALKTAQDLAQVGPALEMLQFASSIGAIASVANVGISIAGFAAVLHRLKRIEGKLDQMIVQLDGLRDAVRSLGVTADMFLMARLASAKENLDRAVVATTERERFELARDARRLFQESRLRYLQLWKHVDPWRSPEVEIPTAMELQGRYVASAIGELQSEFLLGDTGAFLHASRSASTDIRDEMALDPRSALRMRSNAASGRVGRDDHTPLHQALFITATLDSLGSQLKLASATTAESANCLSAFAADAELPEQLALQPHEIMRLVKEAPDIDVVAIGRLE